MRFQSNLKSMESRPAKKLKTEFRSRTETKTKEVSFIWSIDHFSYRPEDNGEKIQSEKFPLGENDDLTEWRLEIFPKGESSESENFLSIQLMLESSIKPVIYAKFVLSIIDEKNKKCSADAPFMATMFKKGSYYICEKFISLEKLMDKTNEYLPDDTLTICCELGMMIQSTTTIQKNNGNNDFIYPESKFRDCLRKSFHNQDENGEVENTMIILNVKGKKIAVQKAILASRSPVFAAKFREKFKDEKKPCEIDIPDIDPKVFNILLEYIYTDEVSNLDETAEDLLAAANQYRLDRLKVICEEFLFRNLSVENASRILLHSDLCNAMQLKTKVMKFVFDNLAEVLESPEYKTLEDSYPEIIVEMVRQQVISEVIVKPEPSNL